LWLGYDIGGISGAAFFKPDWAIYGGACGSTGEEQRTEDLSVSKGGSSSRQPGLKDLNIRLLFMGSGGGRRFGYVAGLAHSFQIASMFSPSHGLSQLLGVGATGTNGDGFGRRKNRRGVIKKFNGDWWLLGKTAVAASGFGTTVHGAGRSQWGPQCRF
jgi:hypothetical protein